MATPIELDRTGAAVVYSASNVFNWAQQLLVPGIQAAANILLMERQKKLYEEIAEDQRAIVDSSLANYISRINQILPLLEEASDDVVQAAEYIPVNPCQEQGCTIECNISHIVRADVWAQCINRHHEQNDIARAVSLDPRYAVNIDMFSQSVQDLLRGKLGASDVMEVMTDTAETSALQGRIGGCRHLTSRNLGLARLRAQAVGRQAFQEQMAMLNRDVSPTSRQMNIKDMMVTPQQRIALALTQAQLIQNSLQNVYAAAAKKPPYLMAQFQVQMSSIINRLKGEASKASMVNGFVPDYATALQPLVNGAANLFKSNEIKTADVGQGTSNVTPEEGGNRNPQNGTAVGYYK